MKRLIPTDWLEGILSLKGLKGMAMTVHCDIVSAEEKNLLAWWKW